MKRAALAVVLAFLSGCATYGQREASVTLPTGEVYLVKLPRDAQLEFKLGEAMLKVNLQGSPSPIDSLTQIMALKYVNDK